MQIPQFQSGKGYTDVPTATVAKERVSYHALKFQVEFMPGSEGQLTHYSSRVLQKGHWGLKIEERETLAYLRTASSLASDTDCVGLCAGLFSKVLGTPRGDEDDLCRAPALEGEDTDVPPPLCEDSDEEPSALCADDADSASDDEFFFTAEPSVDVLDGQSRISRDLFAEQARDLVSQLRELTRRRPREVACNAAEAGPQEVSAVPVPKDAPVAAEKQFGPSAAELAKKSVLQGDSGTGAVAAAATPRGILKESSKDVADSLPAPSDVPVVKGPAIKLERTSPEKAKAVGANTWARAPKVPFEFTAGQRAWMDRISKGDLSGLDLDPSCYMELRNQNTQGNPRVEPSYKQQCIDAAGLGEKVDSEIYGHITNPADIELLRWCVRRGSGCMWLPESPRTSIKGFLHRLITQGPPVRIGVHRLSRQDTEFVERCIKEDVDRGQLDCGSSEWGFQAFPTKESAPHQPIKRKPGVVVDYHALNRVTLRKCG